MIFWPEKIGGKIYVYEYYLLVLPFMANIAKRGQKKG
jgi:hypothetical protein